MTVCKNCGAELNEKDLYCSVCGTKVEEKKEEDIAEQSWDEIEEKSTIVYCKFCGKQLDDDVDVCPECGAKLTDNVNKSVENEQVTLNVQETETKQTDESASDEDEKEESAGSETNDNIHKNSNSKQIPAGMVVCPECNGTGKKKSPINGIIDICITCEGKGYIKKENTIGEKKSKNCIVAIVILSIYLFFLFLFMFIQ